MTCAQRLAPSFALLPRSFSQAVQYPQMLLQLVKAGFSLGHVADMNYLTRPVSCNPYSWLGVGG